ncbi:MAG: hypothetical protein AAGE03_11840, partial [Pseudomonadota bacterium]
KLDPHRSFLIELIDQDGDMTMPELAGALADATGVQAHPDAIGRFLRSLASRIKKDAGRDRATPCKGKETARGLGQIPPISGRSPAGTWFLHCFSGHLPRKCPASQWTKPLSKRT